MNSCQIERLLPVAQQTVKCPTCNGGCVSIVTVGEGLLQGNEISLVRKKLSCPIADGGDLTLTRHNGPSSWNN